MKALNPTGKTLSLAEQQQTQSMIKALLEDVQKQAASGAAEAAGRGGKSEAEKKADAQMQQNNKEFIESQKQ